MSVSISEQQRIEAIEKAIIDYVEENDFVKIIQLIADLSEHWAGMKTTSEFDIISHVYKMVNDGKIREIEYLRDDNPNRLKTLLVSNKIKITKANVGLEEHGE